MPELAPRIPCPVCLGVNLRATPIGDAGDLMLDHCERCGGVWFDLGELPALRRCRPKALWTRIGRQEEPHRMPCHSCRTFIDRNDVQCDACGWENRLDCPHCGVIMQQAVRSGVRVDVCRACKGAWFDHHELAAIWNDAFDISRERRGAVATGGEGGILLLDALAFDPFLTYYGVYAAGHAIGASAEVLSHAPEAAAGAIEAAGEVAGGVFETICEILAGLFS